MEFLFSCSIWFLTYCCAHLWDIKWNTLSEIPYLCPACPCIIVYISNEFVCIKLPLKEKILHDSQWLINLNPHNTTALTFFTSGSVFIFDGWPLEGRGASGVTYTEFGTAEVGLPWKSFVLLLLSPTCLGVSEIPKMFDFVLPPLPARWPLDGLWWREVVLPVTDRSGWELFCQKLI